METPVGKGYYLTGVILEFLAKSSLHNQPFSRFAMCSVNLFFLQEIAYGHYLSIILMQLSMQNLLPNVGVSTQSKVKKPFPIMIIKNIIIEPLDSLKNDKTQ